MSTLAKSAVKAEPKATTAPARTLSALRTPAVQRKCACESPNAECETCRKREREQILQKSSSGPARTQMAPPIVAQVLRSPGRPLDSSTRSFMEPRFGRDFSGVRVHSDSQAVESARAVDAHAYTVGQHIVFDSGKYDPHSGAGRSLLAHELAHTVQQHGLQRSSDDLPLGETREYQQLEREADSIGQAVMSSSSRIPALTSHPVQPLISRKSGTPAARGTDEDTDKTAKSEASPKDAQPGRAWSEKVDPKLKAVGVKQRAQPPKDAPQDIPVFNMGNLDLPAKKGKVKEIWDNLAKEGALEAMIDPGGKATNPKIALKQERPPTDELKNIWLQKVGWKKENEEEHWKSITSQKDTFRKTAAAKGSPCQVDHIVELQFGGNNVPGNMQMLDGPENMSSGASIFADLKTKAIGIRQALKEMDPASGVPEFIILHFEGVTQTGLVCGPCCEADAKAKQIKDVGPGESVGGEKGVPYHLISGGREADLLITAAEVTDKKKPVPIRQSKVPENQSAATLISGLLLEELERKTSGPDKISARLDTESKTKLPVTLDGTGTITLSCAKGGKLTLPPGNPHLKFHYPFLSAGTFTHLKLEDDDSLSGTGELRPTIPFLPVLHVKFDKDSFAIVAPLDAKKLKPPIPGAKITEGEIGLQLGPDFKPYGSLGFELATGAKRILDGKLEVSADAQGLVATGVIHVFLPGVDNAQGDIKYQGGEWTGGVKIETAQLQNKLKYVQSASVVVGFSSKGIAAAGDVMLAIPHTDGVKVSLIYEKHKWLFRGKGSITPPRLQPVDIEIEYDGEHLSGSAHTGFKFHGMDGQLALRYHDEKFSGEGTIEINKKRARGKLKVKMRQVKDEPKFSGEGEVSYQLTENLVATAGITVDEEEHVRLKGALEFPKPIPLFKPIQGDYKIFEIGVSIPIPGASIGPVGLKARIEGELSAGYKIGPGELRNAKVEAAFNPLEEKPDLDVNLHAQLYIGASAHISGAISGSIVVDVGIASVSGGLTVTATAMLDGHIASEVTIHYEKSRFVVDANFDLLLALALMLALDAFVKAEAGIGPFKVEKKKVWNLAAYKFDTGMKLGMKLKKPLHYASDEPFQYPSLNDIEWIKPTIDPKQVLERVFSGGGGKEEQA